MLLLNDPFPKNITATTTDREIDFSFVSDQYQFSPQQERHLRRTFDGHEKLINIKQVHGNKIVVITDETVAEYSVQEADGIITDLNNTVIAVRTADCLPVFLYSKEPDCAGIVHAGWRGTQKEIIRKAVEQMRDCFNVDIENIAAAFGPCIRKCCYEVGKEFQKNFPEETKLKEDKYYFDLVLANKNQLLGLGIDESNIFDDGICTCCDEQYFSYRREEGAAGRMLSAIALKGELLDP